jgi:16S rRNA G966 N2-methylase RsmD
MIKCEKNKYEEISLQIKNISQEQIIKEFCQLKEIVKTNTIEQMSERCLIGNGIVDHFTFTKRLHTRGKYNVNFYEFVERIEEFKQKKFIQNMFHYYATVKNKNGQKNQYVVLKEIYNICISSINIIRPLNYMEIYAKYKPTCVLDFCAGWGGALVAAVVLNVPRYIGIEINESLCEPYSRLKEFLDERENVTTEFEIMFQDALSVNYSALKYDLVFTSPPYYFIQKYENNVEYCNKRKMDKEFYIPLFTKTYAGLSVGGNFVLNINKEIYENVCIDLFGEAHEVFFYKKSRRQNDYKEMIYAWIK